MIPALLGALAFLALIGLPLFLVILGTAMFGGDAAGLQREVLFVEIYQRMTDNPIFMTIPLFAHAGFVLSESRAPERLVELTRSALGFVPGGAAIVTIVACALFTAFTGASGVTIIALGGLLLPVMTKERYPERFNLGLITTGGSLGLLFPPSLPLIIYALIASNIAPVDIDTLFLAGAVPGVFLMAVLALYGSYVGVRHSTREKVPFRFRRVGRAFGAAIFELPIPFIIIGGIFGGFMTLSQAAAVVAIYVTFIEVFIYQDLTIADLWRTTTRSMVLVGGILMVIMAALALTNLLTNQEIPMKILALMREHIKDPITFLLLLNLFLLIVGCLMDIYSAILVVVPLILPIALSFGIDPVHLGIIFLTNLEIGYSTPPVGINLFISSLRFNKPVVALYRASLPFIGLLLICLLVITFVPALSMFLVRAVEGTGTVEVAWASGGQGQGTMRWRQRDPEADDLDADTWFDPGDGDRREASDLILRYRPLDQADAENLAAGSEPVACRFELGRADETGWSLSAAWTATVARLGDLQGHTGEVDGISIVPADSAISRIPDLQSENWTDASQVSIESVEGGRIKGVVRGVILYFPISEDEPEQIYDLEVSFEAEAQLVQLGDLPSGAPKKEIPDVRLSYRPVGAEGEASRLKMFVLERTRPLPWNVAATFLAEVDTLEDLAGHEGPVDAVRLEMRDVELPLAEGRILMGRVKIESVVDGVVTGVVQAVMTDAGGRRSMAVEFRFSLEAHEQE